MTLRLCGCLMILLGFASAKPSLQTRNSPNGRSAVAAIRSSLRASSRQLVNEAVEVELARSRMSKVRSSHVQLTGGAARALEADPEVIAMVASEVARNASFVLTGVDQKAAKPVFTAEQNMDAAYRMASGELVRAAQNLEQLRHHMKKVSAAELTAFVASLKETSQTSVGALVATQDDVAGAEEEVQEAQQAIAEKEESAGVSRAESDERQDDVMDAKEQVENEKSEGEQQAQQAEDAKEQLQAMMEAVEQVGQEMDKSARQVEAKHQVGRELAKTHPEDGKLVVPDHKHTDKEETKSRNALKEDATVVDEGVIEAMDDRNEKAQQHFESQQTGEPPMEGQVDDGDELEKAQKEFEHAEGDDQRDMHRQTMAKGGDDDASDVAADEISLLSDH